MIPTQTVIRAVTIDQVRAAGPIMEEMWVVKAKS